MFFGPLPMGVETQKSPHKWEERRQGSISRHLVERLGCQPTKQPLILNFLLLKFNSDVFSFTQINGPFAVFPLIVTMLYGFNLEHKCLLSVSYLTILVIKSKNSVFQVFFSFEKKRTNPTRSTILSPNNITKLLTVTVSLLQLQHKKNIKLRYVSYVITIQGYKTEWPNGGLVSKFMFEFILL